MRRARLRPVLPRRPRHRGARRPVDAADRPGAGPRQHPLQRHRPRPARHLPVAARPAPAPPRAQGRRRARGRRRPGGATSTTSPRRARTSRPSSTPSGAGRSSGCSTTSDPHEVDPVTLTWWMHRRIDEERLPPGRVVIEFDHTAPERQADLDGARPRRGVGVHPAPRLRARRGGDDDDAGARRGVPGPRRGPTPWRRAPSGSTARPRSCVPCPAGSCGARSPTPPVRVPPSADHIRPLSGRRLRCGWVRRSCGA